VVAEDAVDAVLRCIDRGFTGYSRWGLIEGVWRREGVA